MPKTTLTEEDQEALNNLIQEFFKIVYGQETDYIIIVRELDGLTAMMATVPDKIALQVLEKTTKNLKEKQDGSGSH